MKPVRKLIPNKVGEVLGYHHERYRHFTRHADRLKDPDRSSESFTPSRVRWRRVSSDKVALFATDCIFCNKKTSVAVRKAGTWTTEGTHKFKSGAWKTVLESAESKHDEKLLVRIRCFYLFASEAHFHASCRKGMLKTLRTGEVQIVKRRFIKKSKRQHMNVLFRKYVR